MVALRLVSIPMRQIGIPQLASFSTMQADLSPVLAMAIRLLMSRGREMAMMPLTYLYNFNLTAGQTAYVAHFVYTGTPNTTKSTVQTDFNRLEL